MINRVPVLEAIRVERLAGLLAILALMIGSAAAADPPANVILITVDTLRADHLGCYGRSSAQTPAIDRLAAEGVLFEQAIVQTPITLPSHASILTGTYPHYHGLQDVVGRMLRPVPTLGEWFQQRGYATGAFVGSSVLMRHWGLDRGFDHYDDQIAPTHPGEVDLSRLERPAAEVLDPAWRWIQSLPSGKPFFNWVHLYDPHDPYEPPAPFDKSFASAPYDGEIAYVDQVLGEFFERLQAAGLYDNSLIIFTSDHGESLGEHQEQYHAFFIYEASLQVPLVIRLPRNAAADRYPRGHRVSQQVRSVDIAPTLLQLLGASSLPHFQGESLAGLMAGRTPSRTLPAYAETHYPRIHFGWSPLFSFSNGRYKFIEAPTPELYDLQGDPGELRNIYSRQQALGNQLREQLHELQRRYAGAETATGEEEATSETIERLKALGYVAFSSGSSSRTASDLPDPKTKIEVYNQLNRAISLSREQKVEDALKILRQVSAREPTMPLVHFLMGSEYARLGLHLKAAEEFDTTITLNPESNVARFNLAQAYSRSGLTEKAEQVLNELIQREPENYGAKHLLASIRARKGDYRRAVALEEEVVRLRPDFLDALINLGSYQLNLGLAQQAANSYSMALQLNPDSYPAAVNLALSLIRLGQFDGALEAARRAVTRHPTGALGHYYLGQVFQAKGMTAQAEESFRRAGQLDPKLAVPGSNQ